MTFCRFCVSFETLGVWKTFVVESGKWSSQERFSGGMGLCKFLSFVMSHYILPLLVLSNVLWVTGACLGFGSVFVLFSLNIPSSRLDIWCTSSKFTNAVEMFWFLLIPLFSLSLTRRWGLQAVSVILPSVLDQAVAIFCYGLKDRQLYRQNFSLKFGVRWSAMGFGVTVECLCSVAHQTKLSSIYGCPGKIKLAVNVFSRRCLGLVGSVWFPPYLLGFDTVIGNIDWRLDTWDMGYHPCSPTDVGVVQRWVFNVLQGQGLLHDNPTISLS